MVLIDINNKNILTRLVTYLDNCDIPSTIDKTTEFNKIIIDDIKNPVIADNKIKKYFLLYDMEEKIYKNSNKKSKRSIKYIKDIIRYIDKCDFIITSLPYFRNYLSGYINKNKIIIIEKQIPNLYKITSKKSKNILIFDPEYNNIDIANDIAIHYPKNKIEIIGFSYDKLTTVKTQKQFENLNPNIDIVKYYDEYIYTEKCLSSNIIIYCSNKIADLKYLYLSILVKKKIIVKEELLYQDYLVNSKNIYTFRNNKELIIKTDKIINNRLANLTLESYEIIKDNDFDKISVKLSKYLK